MKLIIALGLVLTGCTTYSNPTNDTYAIEWQGAKGGELFGSYVVTFPQTPDKPSMVEQVKASLPHKVTVSLPKNVMVSAVGFTLNKPVEVKIYRNGKECGKAVMEGSGAICNKVCQ